MDTFAMYNVSTSSCSSNCTAKEVDESDFLHHDIIYTFVCFVAIVCNIFLITNLIRFKRMRTRRNVIVLNWALADTLHMIANIFSFDILPYVGGLYRFDEYFCGIFETRAMLHTATVIFVLWLLMDCTFQKCARKCVILTIILVWVVVYLSIIASVALCVFGVYLPYSYTSLLLTFFVLLLGTLIYSCVCVGRAVKHVQAEDSRFRYSAVAMYVFCWIGNVACFYLSLFLHNKFLYNVSKSLAIVGYMNVVINLFLFALLDRNYGLCFANVFRCNRAQYVNERITYAENADIEFLYTSLKPSNTARSFPKPEKFAVVTDPHLGTAV